MVGPVQDTCSGVYLGTHSRPDSPVIPSESSPTPLSSRSWTRVLLGRPRSTDNDIRTVTSVDRRLVGFRHLRIFRSLVDSFTLYYTNKFDITLCPSIGLEKFFLGPYSNLFTHLLSTTLEYHYNQILLHQLSGSTLKTLVGCILVFYTETLSVIRTYFNKDPRTRYSTEEIFSRSVLRSSVRYLLVHLFLVSFRTVGLGPLFRFQ